MAWFTGTSTGDRYEVGDRYTMGGDTYVANANGTFTNERSGNTTAGSYYGNGHATFSDYGNSSERSETYNPKPLGPNVGNQPGAGGTGVVATGPVTTTGAGVPAARSSGRGSALSIPTPFQAGRLNANTPTPWGQDFVKDQPLVNYRGLDGFIPMGSPTYMPGRQFPFLSLPMEMNPYVPPAQIIEDEVGEGEFLSPGWFANWAAAAGHAAWNIERAGDFINRSVDQALHDEFPGIAGARAEWERAAGQFGATFSSGLGFGGGDVNPMEFKPMSSW